MDKKYLNEINNLSISELETIINKKAHLFSPEEMKAVITRYELLGGNNANTIKNVDSLNSNKRLISDLRNYKINNGELNEFTNTYILLGIYKCVNIIKNIFIASLVCGTIAIIISLLK